jgi:hypothetical protein
VIHPQTRSSGFAIYVLVAVVWIAPDPRIERAMADS